MHNWGDAWFEHHGTELDSACDYISMFCKRWGRFGGYVKEKYGTLRFYANFHSMLHDLIFPGYVWNQYKYHWLWSLDIKLTSSYIYSKTIARLIQSYQIYIYQLAYRKTAKRWPAIKEEIYVDADFSEFLEDDFPFNRYWKQP